MSIDINNVNSLFPREGSTTTRKHSVTDDYPKLNLPVYIEGNCFLSGAIELFAKAGCTRARTIEEAKLVVFLGGEDVDPSLYGEKAHRTTYFNKARDDREIDTFTTCVTLDKPMFGICRGMQFLHVMNGGKLYQNVSAVHSGTHFIRDCETGEIIRASSMHHQMCIENDTTFATAYAWNGTADGKEDEKGVSALSGVYETFSRTVTDPHHLDLEAAIYPNIRAVAVQGHPEVGGYPDYSAWCIRQIKTFLEDKSMMGQNTIDKNIPFLHKGVDV